ncbi:MAG: hypothetical protein A2086_09770 [Spirochaetes bacterium GWD1_27_9]|nr:MAG: hypothetical protein A2Z98_01055 [Spirochaetes bacterium GWB1_27_13]OHD25876.1 MAG: hypothetical protein A2Y34_15355 [Spirochaetes bacterium GWC1_27_15]OHD33483.1 MAG: hypothetical protein A2086_09770 [Spirochaetes bacterium GWD1_27_9]
MDIKIPLIGSIIIFIIIFFMNILNGNSFSVLIVRSLISGLIVFGLLFGVIFFLKDILKIDFSTQTPKDNTENPSDNKVDFVVGDEEEGSGDSLLNSNSSNFNQDEENITTSDDGGGFSSISSDNKFDESIDSGVSDFNAGDTTGFGNISSSGDSGQRNIKDVLGFDASPEELAKAIKTKMNKDE